MTKYQFEADDELWTEWKNTVPRDKALDQRIRELLKADADGRVQPSDAADGWDPDPDQHRTLDDLDDQEDVVDDDQDLSSAGDAGDEITAEADPGLVAQLDLPGQGQKLIDRQQAVIALLGVLDDADGAVRASVLRETVYPDHPAGYESERSWWKNCMQPALKELDDAGRVELVDRAAGEWSA